MRKLNVQNGLLLVHGPVDKQKNPFITFKKDTFSFYPWVYMTFEVAKFSQLTKSTLTGM